MVEKKKAVPNKVKRPKSDPHAWKRTWTAQKTRDAKAIESLARDYMVYLDRAKTEREAVQFWLEQLLEMGSVDLESRGRKRTRPGRLFHMVNRGKQLHAGVVGRADLQNGVNMVVTHLDAPRIDLKPRPIDGDEDTGIGFFRTHYYGGIKKYHWVNIPLALHGRVVKGDGSSVDLVIGEERKDPVFVIPDLLPHLSRKIQNRRKLADGIRGEELNALIGTGDLPGEDDEALKPVVKEVLAYLNSEYDIIEEDLVSSDLCLVPAWGSREIGLDRGLIGAYGHDNRVSSFCGMRALLDLAREKRSPERWCTVMNFDKEEIGSDGSTGAKSEFLEMSIYEALDWAGSSGNRRELLRTLSGSFGLSADVKSAINPSFKGVQDPNNSARLGAGITITKYTGRGGKVGANDASAEMVGEIRRLFNGSKVTWQMQETGRVDMGGGGTVAKFLAVRNMDVLDTGIPLLSMHSPYEVMAKTDLYTAWKGFRVFLEKFRE
ncbi:MAG: aminopeptidase [Candidatus Thermoplasmatota archaeon]|nr:aminopeptidase [Candidatus Thermoplasmatota archaeon]